MWVRSPFLKRRCTCSNGTLTHTYGRERERQVERKRSVSSPCGQSCLPTRRRAPIPRCTNGSPGSFFFLFFFSFSVLTKVEITSRLQTFCSTLISRCNQVYTCLPEFRVNLWDVGQTCFFLSRESVRNRTHLVEMLWIPVGSDKKKWGHLTRVHASYASGWWWFRCGRRLFGAHILFLPLLTYSNLSVHKRYQRKGEEEEEHTRTRLGRRRHFSWKEMERGRG